MSVDYIAGNTTDGLTLKLYRGEDMVLLAFDIDDSLKKPDFVGFGIQYFIGDSTQPRDVFNFLMFKRVRLKAKNAAKHIQLMARASMRSPIQQFRWAHVPSVPLDGPVTYQVSAMFWNGDNPIIAKATKKLGLDQVEVRRLNAPTGQPMAGPPTLAEGGLPGSSVFLREALARGAELFEWESRKAQSGKRSGTKIRGVGVGVSGFFAGSNGFDGLLVIRPDGSLQVQSGVGNFGTESVSDVHRVAAELLGVPWERVEITWGNTGKHLPWTCISGGSQTTHAMTRAAHAAATTRLRPAPLSVRRRLHLPH